MTDLFKEQTRKHRGGYDTDGPLLYKEAPINQFVEGDEAIKMISMHNKVGLGSLAVYLGTRVRSLRAIH